MQIRIHRTINTKIKYGIFLAFTWSQHVIHVTLFVLPRIKTSAMKTILLKYLSKVVYCFYWAWFQWMMRRSWHPALVCVCVRALVGSGVDTIGLCWIGCFSFCSFGFWSFGESSQGTTKKPASKVAFGSTKIEISVQHDHIFVYKYIYRSN